MVGLSMTCYYIKVKFLIQEKYRNDTDGIMEKVFGLLTGHVCSLVLTVSYYISKGSCDCSGDHSTPLGCARIMTHEQLHDI